MMAQPKRLLWILPVVAAAAIGSWRYAGGSTHSRHTPDSIRALAFAPYAPQKAVYHVTEGGGLFARSRYRNLLEIARNHVYAVGAGRLDLRIVLQGDGIELLELARRDGDIAGRIDALKRQGVRFLVCRNTIIGHDLDPAEALYGVGPDDIVPAGIAEATALVQKGFAYLKPLG